MYFCAVSKSILFIILSGLSFFCVNFLVKLLGHPETYGFHNLQQYPAHELVFARSLVSFSISFAIIKYRKLPVLGNNRRWLLLRGTAGMIALFLFFLTIHELPLAIASTLQYLSPIFTVLIASFLFKEQVTKWQYLTSLIAFSGVCVIGLSGLSKNSAVEIHPLWVVVGVVSSFLSGIAYNAISKLKHTESAINIVIYFPMLALPVFGTWTFIDGILPQGIEWLFLLLIGIFTQIAQVLMTKAFLDQRTSLLVPFQYLGAIYALIAGWMMFDERLSLLHIGAIICILVGVIVGALVARKQTA